MPTTPPCGLGLDVRVSRHEHRVAATGGEQIVVRARLDDPAPVEDDDLIRVPHGREPVGDRDRRAPLGEPLERLLDSRSVWVSSAEVASSRTRIGGFRRTVRAIAIRCFSPPEKR